MNRSILGDDPLVCRVLACTRFNEVSFQLRLFTCVVSVIRFIKRQFRKACAVPCAGTVEPSVIALLTEGLCQYRVVVAVRIRQRFIFGSVHDDCCQSAGIESVVIVRRDLE